ncbi:MAG: ABC transporter transmembrane domain-containing protein, partial [Clostridiales bacterium]|nr:ABC transporter transmembrane domain-containing protein [Clostridiales bacterium]
MRHSRQKYRLCRFFFIGDFHCTNGVVDHLNALLPMPLYIPKLIEKKLQNAKNESIDSFQKHLGNTVEWLSGFELIKNYSIEKVIARKFRESNEEVSEKLFRFKKVTYLSKTITALLSYMSHFIVIVATAALVLNGDFSAGDFFIA